MCNAYKIHIIAPHTIQYYTQLHSKVCVCAANTKPLQNKYTQQNVDFANSLTIQYHGTRRCMELCMMKTITAMLIMTFTQKTTFQVLCYCKNCWQSGIILFYSETQFPTIFHLKVSNFWWYKVNFCLLVRFRHFALVHFLQNWPRFIIFENSRQNRLL